MDVSHWTYLPNKNGQGHAFAHFQAKYDWGKCYNGHKEDNERFDLRMSENKNKNLEIN